MRKLISLVLCLFLLSGCAAQQEQVRKQYTATFLTLFDTVTNIVGQAVSEEEFQAIVQPIRDELEYYHRLFDIYHEYEGIHNLKTINDQVAGVPVTVDAAVLDLLQDCKDYSTAVGGVFNPAMGGVLKLWHNARENGINDPAHAYLPDALALEKAAQHQDPENILLDRELSTVTLLDPEMKLDVGGIAKGWAVQRVCEKAPKGLLISVGGNVYATGPKTQSGTAWGVGIQNPSNSGDYLHILNITEGSVVTSGNYQRAYVVDGKLYHHIIDPNTLYPSELWISVTVVCKDSGLADVLSTTLFLLGREEGQALLDRFGAQAMWVDALGNQFYSPGFQDLIRN